MIVFTMSINISNCRVGSVTSTMGIISGGVPFQHLGSYKSLWNMTMNRGQVPDPDLGLHKRHCLVGSMGPAWHLKKIIWSRLFGAGWTFQEWLERGQWLSTIAANPVQLCTHRDTCRLLWALHFIGELPGLAQQVQYLPFCCS